MVSFSDFIESSKDFTCLDENVLNIKLNLNLLREVVRWQLARKRSGTRKTKGISDIKATTRKPHKQKGTGKARQGSLVSPQFRGGAVIFGPVVRDHSFSLNKKVRKLAVRMALAKKMNQGELLIISDDQLSSLQKLDFTKSGKKTNILLVLDHQRLKVTNRDNYYVNTMLCDNINTYSIIRCDYLVLTHASVDYLNKRFV